jgi:hypothetical protein
MAHHRANMTHLKHRAGKVLPMASMIRPRHRAGKALPIASMTRPRRRAGQALLAAKAPIANMTLPKPRAEIALLERSRALPVVSIQRNPTVGIALPRVARAVGKALQGLEGRIKSSWFCRR